MDYVEAKDIITKHAERVGRSTGIVATRANLTAKQLKNQTWLHYDKDGHYTLSYFNKNIIEYHPGYVVVNDRGFFSSSTMQRFNEYLPRGFSIRGCTYTAFKLLRPLGFITTPAGNYPYSMPSSFTYEGAPFDHGGLYADARGALLRIPKYVDQYLDELLQNKPSSVDDEATSHRAFLLPVVGAFDSDKYRISRLIGTSIMQGATYKHMAALAVQGSSLHLSGMELDSELVPILISHGAAPFRRKTIADKMEAALAFARKLPNINEQQLRKTIRYLVIEHLVNLLGFDVVQWNRRE